LLSTQSCYFIDCDLRNRVISSIAIYAILLRRLWCLFLYLFLRDPKLFFPTSWPPY